VAKASITKAARDATSQKVEVALYGMHNKLHKQLKDRNRAEKRT